MDLSAREVGRALGLGNEATARVLAARPIVDDETVLPDACSEGVLVARLDPRLDPLSDPGVYQPSDGVLVPPRRLAFGRAAVLKVLLVQHGRVPLVTTVSGFVLAGADVTGRGVDDADPPRTVLTTTEPGDWFAAFAGRRLLTGPGDPWLFWRCRLCPQIPRDRPRRREDRVA